MTALQEIRWNGNDELEDRSSRPPKSTPKNFNWKVHHSNGANKNRKRTEGTTDTNHFGTLSFLPSFTIRKNYD
uniref:Uncharacterized protein n=1 Tax=Megaselia scalaris TaxID=36166 RepID=T1GPB8_MEGSC